MAGREAGHVEGIELHSRVERDRWCVTRNDLAAFRRLVQKGVRNEEIKRTALDDFGPHDRIIGPSLYTVNEQLVKPVTKAAGGMSWALMLHPTGLKCDLFVTHAWQEGVYELIDKVLYSWPQGAKHAYICVLANPQNLDIGGLISEPSESPFARSLAAAHWMVVVPNQKGSIYQRMWCAYEAYLAYTEDKVILVARVPSSRMSTLRASAGTAAAALAGVAAGALRARLARSGVTQAENVAFWPATILPYLGSAIFSSRWLPGLRRACHFAGAIAFGYFLATAELPNVNSSLRDHAEAVKMQAVLLMGVCYFVIAEVDTVRSSMAYAETEQLRRGYSGSIMDASCTVQRDTDYILQEISGKAREVDHAIQVLIRAGMWNHSMHQASDAGVDLKGASHINFATPCTVWVVQLVLDLVLLSAVDRVTNLLGCANLVMQILWFVILACKPTDKRAFGIRAMTVVSTVFLSLAMTIHFGFVHIANVNSHAYPLMRSQASLMLGFQALSLAFLLAGVGRVAQWPLCGRRLAQALLMATSWRCDIRCCLCGREGRRNRFYTETQENRLSDDDSDMESRHSGSVSDGDTHDDLETLADDDSDRGSKPIV